jgi:hypothetical protein
MGERAAFERVLRIWEDAHPAPVAARARAALGLLLAGTIDPATGRQLGRSSLTETGSAFEPAFSLAAPGLRYTVDPAPPGLEMHARLPHALDLLATLGAPALPPGLADRLAALQADGALRYGAQIGARHGTAGDRYKLYVEFPPTAAARADAWAAALLGSAPVLTGEGRNARPALAGIDLAGGEHEIYYRIEHLHPREIATLMARAHMAERAPEVLAMLDATQAVPIRHALPGATWGCSYVAAPGRRTTFSLYTFARTLFGPDGWIRAGLLAMGARHGWDLSQYERMSSPLAGRRGIECHHGIVGLVVPPTGPPAAWIGLAPPAVAA